ncbi:MAG: extracellular solute-binding protein [Cohnella sp.]|nr:extracellular solute-binding protein [Cohnella sp.]
MKRKSLLLLACILMLASVLAACSGGNKDAANSGKAPDAKATATPAVKPELKFLAANAGFDPNKDPAAALIEEVTGYKVNYNMLPADKADEKLNLEMASGAYYDLMGVTKPQFAGLVNQNAILPLNDLIDKFGPNIKKAIETKVFNVTTIGGKIYGVPYMGNGELITWGTIVRQDVLDQLGLKMPTTLDELYTTLKTIKEKTDLIPFVSDNAFIESIASGFGLSTQWYESNGQLSSIIKQPGMPQYLEFMAKLYKEGLIDKDLPVSKLETAKEKFASGKAAMMRFGWGSSLPETVLPAVEKNVPNFKYKMMSPLKGANGKSEILVDRGVGRVAVIPKVSKYPEDVIKFIDKKLELDTFKYIGIGKEGVEYKFENGQYYPILPKFNEQRTNIWWYLDAVDTKNWPDYWLARNRKNPLSNAVFTEIQKDKATAGKFDPTSYFPPGPAGIKYVQSLDAMNKEYYIKVIAGAENISSFDKYVSSWDNAGGKELTAEMNELYRNATK